MKKIVLGILAHVDAGKTTLSEAILYKSGMIQKWGRVDNQDAFLDTYALEKERGITIFSKQAEFVLQESKVILLDTPGHVDFSAEMERTLWVLDYAILVVSGADGVQGHTKTLWRLLKTYGIPTFIFVNKMDQEGTNKDVLLSELKDMLDDNCIPLCEKLDGTTMEEIAMCDQLILEEYLSSHRITKNQIQALVGNRKMFPVYFGSALRLEGIEELLDGIDQYTQFFQSDHIQFGAKVFKILRDEHNNRLTYLKVTSGTLKVKDTIGNHQEKINQIRIYAGAKYQTVDQAGAGSICAVTGLSRTVPGEGLGVECNSMVPILEPILSYRVEIPDAANRNEAIHQIKQLEEEIPELQVKWEEEIGEIHASIMGEVQIEILEALLLERFGLKARFCEGTIIYKETINNTVEGVGHFEPLRHYAEVHLLLEPSERGSGMTFASNCPIELLQNNWQNLVLTHLQEKEHRGVLTGSLLTDVKITLVSGKAHQKHTEGGDFRQATCRAVRQGLMKAESVLLEPAYDFVLEIPTECIGRAMTDVECMNGICDVPIIEEGMGTLKGRAPVSKMKGYQIHVNSYAKGHGRLTLIANGYVEAIHSEEVIRGMNYDPENDMFNTPNSVFCQHGAGFGVHWSEVEDYMHVDGYFTKVREKPESTVRSSSTANTVDTITLEEIEEIYGKAFGQNKGSHGKTYTKVSSKVKRVYETYSGKSVTHVKKEEYLLVDGYNVIFAWEELRELAQVDLHSARTKLQDIMCNYQGYKKSNVVVVFDAYRLENHIEAIEDYHNIRVVFTKEAETADQYIEKYTHNHAGKQNITVATSDYMEQIIIRGQGAHLLSARDLKVEIQLVNEEIQSKLVEMGNTRILSNPLLSESDALE